MYIEGGGEVHVFKGENIFNCIPYTRYVNKEKTLFEIWSHQEG